MTFRSRATLLGTGPTLPAETTDTPGYPAGTRFVDNGEDAEAEHFNRAYAALAENTDDLDTRLNRDIGLPEVGAISSLIGNSITINPSGGGGANINYTGTLYLGESGWSGQDRLDQLFQILDEDYQEVTIDGVEVKVTGLTGNSLGDGFVSTLTTLNLNKSIPAPGTNLRVGYYAGGNLSTLPAYAFTHAGLRGLEEVSGELKEFKARFEIGDITLGSPDNQIVVDPGTVGGLKDYTLNPAGYVYTGDSGYGVGDLPLMFQILNDDYSPVVVSGQLVEVTNLAPAIGVGFFKALNVTLTLSATIPAGNYKLILPREDSVGTLKNDALVRCMGRYAHQHPTYQTFTAMLTDGVNSTGGDYSSVTAIDIIRTYTYGGRFLLKKGNYEWNPGYWNYSIEGATVIGDSLEWGVSPGNVTSLVVPSGAIADVYLSGDYQDVFMATESVSRLYHMENIRLTNVDMSPCSARFYGKTYWKGGSLQTTNPGSTAPSAYGAWFSGLVSGSIEDVYFVPPTGTAYSGAAVYLSSITALDGDALTFRNCTFNTSSFDGVDALRLNSVTKKVVFEGCTFIGGLRGYCVDGGAWNASNPLVTFKNCFFRNDYGYLVRSQHTLNFEDCRFITGTANPTYSITAVNTSTETFTVTGDHSHLVASDRFYVSGSTGNDGYYTVVSTSGTGPTDITVSEDVTDATADGEIFYSHGTAEPIFELGSGSMRNCSIFLDDSNMERVTTDNYPKIGLGVEGPATSNGAISVDGLHIECDFPIPALGTLVLLAGMDGAVGNFANVLMEGMPAASQSRGDANSWLKLQGDSTDPGSCVCENLKVITEDAAALAGVTDQGAIVYASNADVDGLYVDSAGGPTAGGNVGSYRGAVFLNNSYVRNFHYGKTNAYYCTHSFGQIRLQASTIDGGRIYRIGASGSANNIIYGSTYSAVKNLNCLDIPAHTNNTEIIYCLNQDFVTIEGNTFRFSLDNTSTTSNALIKLGNYCRVVNNTIQIKRTTVNAIEMNSSGIADSNVIDYLGSGVTPAITDTGDGVIGDNVLSS